jgi:uncharacterized lipoprotein YmbA
VPFQPPVRFFTLDPVPSSLQTTDTSNVSVQVGAVHVPLVLDRQQMVREGAPNSLTISNQRLQPVDKLARIRLA